LALAPDVAALAHAAAATGGAVDPAPAAVFDPAGEVIRYHEDLWPRFVAGSIVLFLLDLLVRRVRVFDRKRTTKTTPKAIGALV
jgi:Ca-activated chloride channel family protein